MKPEQVALVTPCQVYTAHNRHMELISPRGGVSWACSKVLGKCMADRLTLGY